MTSSSSLFNIQKQNKCFMTLLTAMPSYDFPLSFFSTAPMKQKRYVATYLFMLHQVSSCSFLFVYSRHFFTTISDESETSLHGQESNSDPTRIKGTMVCAKLKLLDIHSMAHAHKCFPFNF